MIVWLNGAFGVGKTTTARELVSLMPRARVRSRTGGRAPDRLPARLRGGGLPGLAGVARTGDPRDRRDHPDDNWQELETGLVDGGLKVLHVRLTADETALRDRADEDAKTRGWRLAHIPTYAAARRSWMKAAADVVVDTTNVDAATGARMTDRAEG